MQFVISLRWQNAQVLLKMSVVEWGMEFGAPRSSAIGLPSSDQ